ncbi:MAG: methyltransferase domain-containing protein [Pseudomonadota bacterium]
MTTLNRIFDSRAVRLRRQRASRIADDGALFVHKAAAQNLVERRNDIPRDFNRIAIIGGRGLLNAETLRADEAVMLDSAEGLLAGEGCLSDVDLLPLKDGAFDAIFSLLTLHTANDLPGALIQINRALKPDGVFIGALFSIGTLETLRQAFLVAESETGGGASPRVAPFVDVRDAGGLLQRAGFAMPVADSEEIAVRYSDPMRLVQDLRAMGETNTLDARDRRFLRRDTFAQVLTALGQSVDDEGKIPVSFHITYVTGWAPGPGQPKPLPPGSAKTRLADALGTAEVALKR